MIISTVLASRVQSYERNGAIGLFGNDRQFNVAVSRAIGLCIVIGHPIYSYTDRCWREFIEYCDQNGQTLSHHSIYSYTYRICTLLGSYIGCECPQLKRRLKEISEETELLAQTALGQGVLDYAYSSIEKFIDSNYDTTWRLNL